MDSHKNMKSETLVEKDHSLLEQLFTLFTGSVQKPSKNKDHMEEDQVIHGSGASEISIKKLHHMLYLSISDAKNEKLIALLQGDEA
jgi:hypothetical protein